MSFNQLRAKIEALEIALRPLSVPISHSHVISLLEAMDGSKSIASGERLFVGQHLNNTVFAMDQICSVLSLELQQTLFVNLRGQNKDLYDQQFGLFGHRVDDVFVDSASEISEAGKCLALERYTASVFHLMRAMEIAVSVLANKLGATIVDNNGQTLSWGVITANIGDVIKAMPNGDVKDDWLKVQSLLYSVNRAYRTKTAHPKASYSEEEALAAFHATKSFMQEMSERA